MGTEDDLGYYGILLDEIRDSFKVVTEAVADVRRAIEVLPSMQEDIAGLKDDRKAVNPHRPEPRSSRAEGRSKRPRAADYPAGSCVV